MVGRPTTRRRLVQSFCHFERSMTVEFTSAAELLVKAGLRSDRIAQLKLGSQDAYRILRTYPLS